MVPPASDRIPPVPPYSGSSYVWFACRYGPFTLCGRPSQTVPVRKLPRCRSPTTPPGPESRRFGLFPVRSPLLGESRLFSLPAGTKMFQFPAFASMLGMDDRPSACRVAPFRNPRIKGRLHLPGAYRSLPRLSSPTRAKASAMCPFLLSPYRQRRNAADIYLQLST